MNNFALTWVVIAAILLIIFWPWVIIWAVNTLFGLGIAYTFWNWLAVLVLTAAFGKTSVSVKK
jgi:hypothetical protein